MYNTVRLYIKLTMYINVTNNMTESAVHENDKTLAVFFSRINIDVDIIKGYFITSAVKKTKNIESFTTRNVITRI